MLTMSLNGQWELQEQGGGDVYPAMVPGCVQPALIAAGRIPDPFYRDNEKYQLWVGDTDWVYRRTFTVDDELLAHQRIVLRCKGLDTLATVRINASEIGRTDNMFRTYEFDVKAQLVAGQNTIEVHFASPNEYVKRMEAERGKLAAWVEPMRTNSGAWIRKEPCNFGWDWGLNALTSGIWRDIDLIAFNSARVTDVHIVQAHDVGRVELTVDVRAEVVTDAPTADIAVWYEGAVVAWAAHIPVKDGAAQAKLTIKNPQLWWVNGLGDQPLYEVIVKLYDPFDQQIDRVSKCIGLRTLTLERKPEFEGESFGFACNGVPFFAKGANWIPASPYPGTVTHDDYHKLIRAAADTHMNMLRVWGGGIYEDDHFYDLCDQYGIAIWQDFMFACGTYPAYDDAFMANVRAEAEDNVRRIRHHPCMALWCGNNEIEQGMPDPTWKQSLSWDDYSRLFDDLLANIVRELAPGTAYWPGSPHSPCGDRENWRNPHCGDTHLWDVWHGRQPFEWYRTRTDRFCSEFGFQSFPSPRITNEFTAPEDRNITSYVMEYHQRSYIGNGTIITYMLEWFKLPTGFESMLWLTQILQGTAMKYAIEHWRRLMPHTMGTLYWQLNDMWPAPTWSSLDWRGGWKALNYMAKRFYAPVLISGLEDVASHTVAVHVTNDKREAVDGTVRWTITTADGTVINKHETPVSVPAISSAHVLTIDAADHAQERPDRDVMVWLELLVGDAVVSDNLVLFARPKHLPLLNPAIELKFEQQGDAVAVTLTAKHPALYVWLEKDGSAGGDDWHISDNFFDLRANTPRTVIVKGISDVNAAREHIRVRSLVDV